MSFALDPRLAGDTVVIGDLALSRLLLMNDARYPWVILVPRREAIAELMELDAFERAALVEELAQAGRVIGAVPGVEKVNIGMLGNVVRQLHAHVVGRKVGDPTWPGPVWGAGATVRYAEAALEARRLEMRRAFGIG